MFDTLQNLRGPVVAVASAGAVLSGLAGYWTTYRNLVEEDVTVSVARLKGESGLLSLLVLPFANQTGSEDKRYLVDAITSDITSDLARIRGATVVPSASAQAYRDRNLPLQKLGREAGVRFVLMGSVLSASDPVRVTVQLADTQTGKQIWSDTFDTPLVRLVDLQDQITGRIYNSIARQMLLTELRNSQKQKTTVGATDLLLQASALSLQGEALDTHEQLQALYRRALQLEPDNLRAGIGLAVSLALQATNFAAELEPQVAQAKLAEARARALRVKEAEPDNPDVYLVLAMFAITHGDLKAAAHAAQARMSLDTHNPRAMNGIAQVALIEGEPQRAIEVLGKAIDLDPRHTSEVLLTNMGLAHFLLGEDKSALEWLLKAREQNPRYSMALALLAMASARMGKQGEAAQYRSELLLASPDYHLGRLALAQNPALWQARYMPAARLAGIPI